MNMNLLISHAFCLLIYLIAVYGQFFDDSNNIRGYRKSSQNLKIYLRITQHILLTVVLLRPYTYGCKQIYLV